MVDWAIGTPSPSLRPLVARYVGYRHQGVTPGLHRGLPSRHLTVVLGLEGDVGVAAMPDPRQSPGAFGALAAGLHAAPALIERRPDEAGVHLDVTPEGARALFGMPASELASTVVDLDDVLGVRAKELRERVAAGRDWPARFAVIDDVLSSVARHGRGLRPEVAWAWQQLTTSDGGVEVGVLAEEIGWSRRHFTEQFRRELGVTPKVAARVLRFERARRLLEAGASSAEAAAACGFYDQAHLTREWRDLAGCTPGTWAAEELPFVQDAGAAAEAS
ncbi:MAG TPA: helix-turn-helix domain-containing protein [Acidimicrobiales bacterium]|nr:helix-turn-helix domain-containing protein [Acidimicrobiales bacterium]